MRATINLEEFLERRKITLGEVVAKVDAAVHLQPDDVLFASGSLIEGIGNEQSDLDLYLLTARQDIEFNACLTDVVVIVGDCVVDVRVVQHSAIDELVARFANWAAAPRQPRRSFEFVEDERKLIYRLKLGRALHGEARLAALQRDIRTVDLARHKLDWARHLASTFQIDLAGFRDVEDRYSITFVAQELLNLSADGLLAASGFWNPNTKWRAHYLSLIPRAIERFVELQRLPPEISMVAAYEYALRIAAFSRAVLPWAERRLLDPSAPVTELALKPHTSNVSDPLPHLDLEVEVRFIGGSFEVVRLNEAGPVIHLTDEEYRLLCCFDGETSRSDVVGTTGFDTVSCLIREAGLEAKVIVDEDLLRRVLHFRV